MYIAFDYQTKERKRTDQVDLFNIVDPDKPKNYKAVIRKKPYDQNDNDNNNNNNNNYESLDEDHDDDFKLSSIGGGCERGLGRGVRGGNGGYNRGLGGGDRDRSTSTRVNNLGDITVVHSSNQTAHPYSRSSISLEQQLGL
eukprot:Pgem_evm1s3289